MPTWDPRANDLFLKALELRTAGERRAYLDATCAGDATLRAEVESLLDAAARAGSFLESPAPANTVDLPPGGERPGTVIGPYKLLQQIGEGGMGTVFMAEQTEPVQRKVALKIIKAGMDSRQVIARFEAERQALALMDHPNIARVFDAGTTPEGRPYFVMELVKGVPITRYCDEHRLTPKHRLELFVTVCQAVQHAHLKGIIHRDLKPSNILVAEYDDRPVAKVIDFGVAKAAGPKLTDRTMFTEFGQLVGTLEYMSPEQAKLNALDIDTRSDVYALGVLLYELLTGTTPFGRKRLAQAAFDEMLRIIREEEPPKPSTRLSESKDLLPSISAQRQTEPARLPRLVRGELDWIVMKALEKDRNRRYETANGFAMDLQRYLADEPVSAGPPRAGYRLRKFVRRNRGPVIAATIALVLLLAGIIGTSTGLLWALRERDDKAKALNAEVAERQAKEKALASETKALAAEKQAREKAMNALRALSDDVVEKQLARASHLTEENKEFLRKIIQHYEGFATVTADDVESRAIRADGYQRVGSMRHTLGELKEAESASANAVTIYKQLTAEFPARAEFRQELAHGHNNLASLLQDTGRLKEAEAGFAAALLIRKQLAADFPARPEFRDELAQSHNNLGNILRGMGRLREAESAYTDGLAILKRQATDFPARPDFRNHLATSQVNLGNLFQDTGRLKEAEAAYADGVDVYRRLVADFPTQPEYRKKLAGSHLRLSDSLRVTGRLKEAEAALGDAVAILTSLTAELPAWPDFRHDLAITYRKLSTLLRETGRLEQADAALGDTLAILKQLAADLPTQPEFRGDLAITLILQGNLFIDTSRLKEAETALAHAQDILKRLIADFPTQIEFRENLAYTQINLGIILHDTGRPKEASVAYTDALAIRKQLAADVPTRPNYRQDLACAHNFLGMLLRDTGRYREAEAAYADALAIRKQLAADLPTRPDCRHDLAESHNNLAILFFDMGRLQEAESAFAAAVAIRKQLAADLPSRPDLRLELAESHDNLGLLFRKRGRLRESEAALVEAAAIFKQLTADFPTRHDFRQRLAGTQCNLGNLFEIMGRLREAEAALADALTVSRRLAAEFPNQPDMLNILAGTCVNLAAVHLQRRNFKAAKACLDEGAPHSETALRANPRNPEYQRIYRNHLANLIRVDAGLADRTAAKFLAEKYRDLGWDPPGDAYNAACVLSRCITVVQNDEQLAPEKRAEQSTFYGDEAMKMLRVAIGKGYKDAAHMKKDTDLDPIRDREDFQKLFEELEQKGGKN